jgi:hypothetical protein
MSALGQKRTLHVRVMSALPPKADIRSAPQQINRRTTKRTIAPMQGATTAARCWPASTYGVEIKPRLVATTKRFPQRTIESTRPIPGTVCPGVTLQTPFGPSITAVPLTTSRSVQPSMVVGLVSGVGVSFVGVRASFTLAPVDAVRDATIESLPASRDSGAVVTDVVEAEETFEFCGASAWASWTIVSRILTRLLFCVSGVRATGELGLCSKPDEIALELRSRLPVSTFTDVKLKGNSDSDRINHATPQVVANKPTISAT